MGVEWGSNDMPRQVSCSKGGLAANAKYLSRRVVLMTAACAFEFAVASCDTPNTRFTDADFGDTKALATGGNLRLITQRPRQTSSYEESSRVVFCTEPSPDYAVAFKRNADVTVQNVVADKPADQVQVKLASDEQVTNLGGRTGGVLALRDGLYAACQAYANGIIGHDAYAAVLAQYGRLIVAVANGQPVPAPTPARPGYSDPTSSAFATVLIACLSEHDPTRLTPTQGYIHNPLLTTQMCRSIIARAGAGRAG